MTYFQYTADPTSYEVTSQKLADRRTTCLNTLASVPSQCVDAVCSHILTTLEANANDVPMSMLYRMDTTAGSNKLILHGQFGFPEGHDLLVQTATIDSEQGLIPDLRRAGIDTMVIEHDERFLAKGKGGYQQSSSKVHGQSHIFERFANAANDPSSHASLSLCSGLDEQC